MTRRTLTFALKLIDPAWGGMYQYSTDFDWNHAHFEKIMSMQAEPMRLYALAYGQFRDERYRQAVRDLHRYVTTFLRSPEGAFYTSQDADLVKGKHSEKYFALDDAARRKLGIPAVDKHRYARENGWMINALATAYAMTGERAYLDDAQRAARWIIANRSLPGGGFRHDEKDVAGPYLEDTLAMSDAFLALYAATGEREWLARAAAGAEFIEQHFRGAQPGYLTSAPRASSRLQPKSNIDENIPLARFANLLHRYTGDARHRAMSDYALRMLVTEQVAGSLLTAPGILLAAFESANDPLHITVVGGKDDAARESTVRLGYSLCHGVSPNRVVGSSRGQHAESRRPLSAAAEGRRLHLHGQHLLVADLRCVEARYGGCTLRATGGEELRLYFFCSSSSFGMPNCPSSSCSLRMSIEPTMFTIVNSRGSLAMMARPFARSCSTRM